MRVLIFHGYLLSGTGSNVYNARLAEALLGLGHEVHLFCQERHPERHPFVDLAGDWDSGSLQLRRLRRGTPRETAGQAPRETAGQAPRETARAEVAARATTPRQGALAETARCTVYRPNIGALLPVYVLDRYEGIAARTFLDCSDAEVDAYVGANVSAVEEVALRVRPDVALANHLVMGPLVLARALGGAVPCAVKVHGSALEYTVKRAPERFLPAAREGLAGATAILVGSRHTAVSLWEALGDPELERRTRLGPPGVDVERFAPRTPPEAQSRLHELALGLRNLAAAQSPRRVQEGLGSGRERDTGRHGAGDTGNDGAGDTSTFARDERVAAAAIERLASGEGELVAFVGKLLAAKGIDLLLAAWPLVLQSRPRARLVVVGFGGWREHVQRLCEALGAGDLRCAEALALPHVLAFLHGLQGHERELYVDAARALPERVVLTGRLDHEELGDLLPACQALVVPSTFPEAFGMVAAEAAACGVLPLSARHSGLAEVSDALARAVPAPARAWLSFPLAGSPVRAIAERLIGWLQADDALRTSVRKALVRVARERWSWEGVARGVIAAASGDLDTLDIPVG